MSVTDIAHVTAPHSPHHPLIHLTAHMLTSLPTHSHHSSLTHVTTCWWPLVWMSLLSNNTGNTVVFGGDFGIITPISVLLAFESGNTFFFWNSTWIWLPNGLSSKQYVFHCKVSVNNLSIPWIPIIGNFYQNFKYARGTGRGLKTNLFAGNNHMPRKIYLLHGQCIRGKIACT